MQEINAQQIERVVSLVVMSASLCVLLLLVVSLLVVPWYTDRLRFDPADISHETIEGFMKERRLAFERSDAQRRFRALDLMHGMRWHQAFAK